MRFHFFRFRRLAQVLALLLLFLAGQYAALAHGVKHPFHEADAGCGLYLHADHQSPALLDPPALTRISSSCEAMAPEAQDSPHVALVPAYAIRAPPPSL